MENKKMTEEKPISARQEARNFVGSSKLRDALGSCGYTISDEAIEKIINACSFALNV